MKRRIRTIVALKEDSYVFPQLSACPVVLMDFRVHVHEINRSVGCTLDAMQLSREDALTDEKFTTWLRNAWRVRIHRGVDMMQWRPMRVVAVSDSKPYWRTVVCRKLKLPGYKGNRGSFTVDEETGKKTRDVDLLLELIDSIGQEVLAESGVAYFKKRLFEADDWAGVAYRIKVHGDSMPSRVMLLSTIDGDWQQLVRDDYHILWANTGPKAWGPRLRGELEVRAHCSKKLGVSLDHPQQMAAAKARVGDAGDNLFEGAPIELYDLVHAAPKARYQIESYTEDYQRFVAQLSDPTPNTSKEILQRTANQMQRLGQLLTTRD